MLAGRDGEAAAAAALVLLACGFALKWRWEEQARREIRRPYLLRDVVGESESEESMKAEFAHIVTWLQDTLIAPIDRRLPGRPFEYDEQKFPFTPMVLLIGNHSSGKSTFINRMLGLEIQETGVAPTDDGFTILERSSSGADEVEDGPTVLGCPGNRAFRELRRFGRQLSGHLKRKRLVLPPSSLMPFDLQIVDTPGMIDMPSNSTGQKSFKARGYNFVEVVRWWANRADLILLLFDPDKPGTTGETLEVLTKSLIGLEHKFLVVLNKIDQLENSLDFARAYGTLGWALSKVIPQKDIPQVYTMYNAEVPGEHRRDRGHILEPQSQKREEVVTEVLRAKVRHWDNVVTSLEETLRQIDMVASITSALRTKAWMRIFKTLFAGFLCVLLPASAAVALLCSGRVEWSGLLKVLGWLGLYLGLCAGAVFALQASMLKFERSETENLDECMEEVYAEYFIHEDNEDLRLRWASVRPKIENMMKAVPSTAFLPSIAEWETARIHVCLENDIWYLRELARRMRGTGPGVVQQRPSVLTPVKGKAASRAVEEPRKQVSSPAQQPPSNRPPPKAVTFSNAPPEDLMSSGPAAVGRKPRSVDEAGETKPRPPPPAVVAAAAAVRKSPPPMPEPPSNNFSNAPLPDNVLVTLPKSAGKPSATPAREPSASAAPPTNSFPDDTAVAPAVEPEPAVEKEPDFCCSCGYTCGTRKALDRHLLKFAGDESHSARK